MKIALRCAACLCALLWLTACGASRQPLVRTEVIEWPVLVYAELPASLTEPVAAPAPPPMGCRLTSGQAVPCVLDGLLREQEWQQLLQRINDDRSTSGRLSSPAAIQKFHAEAPASQTVILNETKVP